MFGRSVIVWSYVCLLNRSTTELLMCVLSFKPSVELDSKGKLYKCVFLLLEFGFI